MVRALLVLFGVALVVVAKDALPAIFLAVMLVLGLDPAATALERRGIGRGKAALLVFAATGLAVVLIAASAKVIARELTKDRRERMAAMREA